MTRIEQHGLNSEQSHNFRMKMKKPSQKSTHLVSLDPASYQQKSGILNKPFGFFELDLAPFIRAARGWNHWSQEELAKRAHVSTATIRRMESMEFKKFRGYRNSVERVIGTLEASGVMFIDPDPERALEGGVLFSSGIYAVYEEHD